jgi:transcriptional regulator GlxA family with amidase domain
LRVLDIAFEAGFGNKNSFYRSFREMHGVAPVEYRRLAMTQGSRPMPAASLRSQSQNPN